MGWGSGVYIFDSIAKALLTDKPVDKKATLRAVIDVLDDGDWDTQQDSYYWDHPIVREIFAEKHPGWFEDEE